MTPAELERRRGELWRLRNEVAFRHPPPTAAAVAAHHAALARIDAELASLPQPEARETGEAAGIVAVYSVLGDRLVRAPDPEPEGPEDDPFLRFARELGQDWQ